MTRAMAIDHAEEGIRVNAVCPGDVETPMLYRSGATRGVDRKTALREANAELTDGPRDDAGGSRGARRVSSLPGSRPDHGRRDPDRRRRPRLSRWQGPGAFRSGTCSSI